MTLDQRLRIAALLARPADPVAIIPACDRAAPGQVTPESFVLTVGEVADLLRVGRTTVYELIRTGELNSIMIGRLRRVRRADVVAHLDQLSRRDAD